MRNRFTDAFIAIVLGAAAALTLSAHLSTDALDAPSSVEGQQPARQGGAAAPAQGGAPAVERRPPHGIESPAVRT
jgi:hypothetical protein